MGQACDVLKSKVSTVYRLLGKGERDQNAAHVYCSRLKKVGDQLIPYYRKSAYQTNPKNFFGEYL